MSVTDCATDTELQGPESEGAPHSAGGRSHPLSSQAPTFQPLKSALVWFAATVTLGLALGSWYVGVRIAAADEPAPPLAPVSPAMNSKLTKATGQDSPGDAVRYAVPVQQSNLYLQVAGLGPRQDANYVKWLHRQGFHAAVQSSNRENSARILIGPFSGSVGMEKARRKLQFAGVLAVEVNY